MVNPIERQGNIADAHREETKIIKKEIKLDERNTAIVRVGEESPIKNQNMNGLVLSVKNRDDIAGIIGQPEFYRIVSKIDAVNMFLREDNDKMQKINSSEELIGKDGGMVLTYIETSGGSNPNEDIVTSDKR